MKWEKFKVQMHPDILEFNATHSAPCQLHHTLTVHQRILPVVFSFMEKIGFERERLYRDGRLGLSYDFSIEARKDELLGGARHMLPFNLAVTGTNGKGVSCYGIHLPDKLYAYVKEVVLPENLSASLDEQDDRLNWHPSQFSAALESYLVYSKDKNEIDDKIRHLLLRYGASDSQRDFRSTILRSDIVQSSLWDREALNGQVRSWLPDFPALDSSQDIEFDPLPLMPPAIKIDDQSVNLMLVLREPQEDEETVLKIFVSPFKKYGFSIGGASINTARRLAVLAVAWILTILKVPRTVSAGNGDGPIHYAIQKVRLSQEFLHIYNSSSAGGHSDLKRSLLPCSLLRSVLPFVSLREVEDFAGAVFTAEKTPISEAISMEVLGAVRRLGIPRLAIEPAFHVLEDVEASSWHRQTITIGTINRCTPVAAENLIRRLLTFTQERHRQQVDRRKTDPMPAIAGVNVSSVAQTQLLKTSTHKMVLQLLQTVVLLGSVDATLAERSTAEGLLEVPPTIRSYVVDVLGVMIQDSFVIAREGNDLLGKWEVLSPFLVAAQRLSEDVPFSPEQWAAARAGEIPMPNIVEERHIAVSLLSRDASSMPSSLKRAWAEKVVEPIVTGHVETRTRWLKAAVAREGGSAVLEASISATYGSGMPVLSSFTAFAHHLSEPQKSLLYIVEHNALAFLSRNPCQELRNLLDKNHPVGWERESYGKHITQLTAYAILDAIGTGSSAMAAITANLTMPNVPPPFLEHVTSSIRRIGSTLLQPNNMSIHANLKAVVPFASFTRFITTYLAQPSKDSLDPKVVALLADFLALAEGFERKKSEESLNRGACYWRVILILKVSVSELS
jgi:hypothetical protein